MRFVRNEVPRQNPSSFRFPDGYFVDEVEDHNELEDLEVDLQINVDDPITRNDLLRGNVRLFVLRAPSREPVLFFMVPSDDGEPLSVSAILGYKERIPGHDPRGNFLPERFHEIEKSAIFVEQLGLDPLQVDDIRLEAKARVDERARAERERARAERERVSREKAYAKREAEIARLRAEEEAKEREFRAWKKAHPKEWARMKAREKKEREREREREKKERERERERVRKMSPEDRQRYRMRYRLRTN